MQRLLDKLEKGEAWKALNLLSFATLCNRELNLTMQEVDGIRRAKKGASLAQALAADPEVKALPKHGGVREQGSVTTLPERGSSYLVRRLKRDAPEIAKALARGEFPSARSAAIAAGIVKIPTILDRLRKLWAKASADERDAFLAEIGV